MNQTIDQIVENENIARIAWEKETVVTEAGHTIADLREAFEVVEDPDHWKNPIVASLLPPRRNHGRGYQVFSRREPYR